MVTEEEDDDEDELKELILANFLFDEHGKLVERIHLDLGLLGRCGHDFECTLRLLFSSSCFDFMAVDKSILRERNVRMGVFARVSERNIRVFDSCNDFFEWCNCDFSKNKNIYTVRAKI